MSRRTGVLCFFLLAAAFLLVNRAAYKGYFQDDELDILSWSQFSASSHYLAEALSPRFSTLNFRPTAHFYFYEALLHFGLDFPKYVLVVHLVHLFNVWLIWVLARRLGASPPCAALGCVFFAFHMAFFDALWKPMYMFDLLCATFCLLSLLSYAKRRWILSFVCYWLAYKSKELAVMLPLALACYEIWFGQRRWKPLVPFFLASLSFGLQGLLLNPNKDNEYTFRFTLAAVAGSSVFYAGRVLLVPYLGFFLPLAAILARNRRTWFGLALMGSLFIPLLFLPGRLFGAYCYAPFTGLAIVLAGVAEVNGALPSALLLILLWLPLDLRELRARRNVTLARDDEIRHWVAGVRQFAATAPEFDRVEWAGSIPGFAFWGVNGALGVAFHNTEIRIEHLEGPPSLGALHANRVAYLVWNRHQLSSAIRTAESTDCPYIAMNEANGVWQLEEGWNDVDGGHRWMGPRGAAHLRRPEGARRFGVRLIVPPDQLSKGPVTLHARLNGVELEPRQFDREGEAEAEWELPPAPPGPVHITFEADPPYQPGGPGDVLGFAFRGFGFLPSTERPR